MTCDKVVTRNCLFIERRIISVCKCKLTVQLLTLLLQAGSVGRMEQPRSTENMRNQLELASVEPLAGSGTLFGDGFSRPWSQLQNGFVSYSTVQQCLSMAEAALSAKQQAAEVRDGIKSSATQLWQSS